MKILGIDPGYERLGIAILENKKILFSDCVRTSPQQDIPERLFEIGRALEEIIRLWQPHEIALETLYFTKNTTTALVVAEVRGIIHYIAHTNNIKTFEYHPNSIKIAITGYGKATKEDITHMIPMLVSLEHKKRLDDELDAIAIALTHQASRKSYPQKL